MFLTTTSSDGFSNAAPVINWNNTCNYKDLNRIEFEKLICPIKLTPSDLSRPLYGIPSDYEIPQRKVTIEPPKKLLSKNTLELLSQTSQDLLNKYKSYVDKDGVVLDGFEDVRIYGDFVVDRSQMLGYGEQGQVFLAQNLETKEFVAAKRLGYPTREGGVKGTAEYQRLARINRARGAYDSDKEDFIFLHLVDGKKISYLWSFSEYKFLCSNVHSFFNKDLDAHDRAKLSYNLLKEFELLAKEDAIPDEMGSDHTMVETDLSVHMIDFCTSGGLIQPRSLSYFKDSFIWDRVIVKWLNGFWDDFLYCRDDYANYNRFRVLENPYVDFVALLGSRSVDPQDALNLLEELMERNRKD